MLWLEHMPEIRDGVGLEIIAGLATRFLFLVVSILLFVLTMETTSLESDGGRGGVSNGHLILSRQALCGGGGRE